MIAMHALRRRFTRRFALVSGLVTLAAALALCLFALNTYWTVLMGLAERRHTEQAEMFFDSALRAAPAFFETAPRLDENGLKAHPAIPVLAALARSEMRGAKVVRLRVHDLSGRTVFSTDRSEIGGASAAEAGFRSARQGTAWSARRDAPGFADLDGIAADRRVAVSYVPIRDRHGSLVAIVSIGTDATSYASAVDRQLFVLLGTIAATLALIFCMILFYVMGDRVLAEQHRRGADLARQAALAEEASRLKSRFLASMGHELRTPLNAVIGYAEAMSSSLFGPLGDPRYDEYSRTIHRAGKHLLAVINDVMDTARIENGKLVLNESEFSLGDLLNDCVQLATPEAAKQRHSFLAAFDRDVPRCRGDEAKIKQIVLNLLSNAIRYTPAGGRIVLTGKAVDTGFEIAVADSGIGIAADQLPLIFEAFRQVGGGEVRKRGGLGLGLAIAKSFAELHGAALIYESTVGRGTTARLLVPAERLRRAPLLHAVAA